MALISTVLLPHSPLLIPEISRANYNFLQKTVAAYDEVSQKIKQFGLDTLIIISPHGPAQEDSFVINVAPAMEINFQDFGFIPKKTILKGDVLLADKLKSALHPDIPLQLISENILDYGSAIPTYLLKNLLGDFKIIVIYPAKNLKPEEYYNFGLKMQDVIRNSNKKIALIASGDLSHRLKKKSPGGYSPKGAKFDNKLIEYLNEPTTAKENILKMDPNLIKEAAECGLKPILVLLGLLDNTIWDPEVLAYQTDFGIGYLSLDFKINYVRQQPTILS